MKYVLSGILTFGLMVGSLTAEDVGDKTKKVADKTVDTTKQAGKAVADKAEDAGDATVRGTKKAADRAEDRRDCSRQNQEGCACHGRQSGGVGEATVEQD